MRTGTRWVMIGAALAAAGCARGEPRAAHGVAGAAELRSELLLANAATAAKSGKGFAQAVGASLTDSAVVLVPGAAIARGREASEAALRTRYGAHTRASTWTVQFAAAAASGDGGYAYGVALLEDSAGTPQLVKYLSYWRHTDGAWKIAALLVNARPDTTPAATPASFVAIADSARAAARDSVLPAEAHLLIAADSAFAARAAAAGVTDAFVAWAAPNAVALDDGADPVYGPEAIGKAMAATPSGAALGWSPLQAYIASSGDLGFTIGTWTYRAPGKGGTAITTSGKYLTVWGRQPSGQWRWVADAGNRGPAAASAH